jgi:integrase
MKTLESLELYKNSNSLSPYTVSNMTNTFKQFSDLYPELPASAYEVNLFLNQLRHADTTRHMMRRHIVSVLKFLIAQLDYPDYIKKIIKIKVLKKKRRYLSKEQLALVYQNCKTPNEKALFLLFFDSPCREGEIGAHPTKSGIYPGLRIEMLTQPRADEEGKLFCTMEVEGKTGHASYRLDPNIREMLLTIASPNGQVFTTPASPNGMTAKAIACMIRELFIRSGITGNKLGPHTIRHSAASFIAKKTGSVLAVMSLLQQTETKSAMGYIHDAQDELKQQFSPLAMLGESFINPQKPIQPKLLVSDNSESSTSLVPYQETPIEYVEGIPDLTEEMFPKIPEDVKQIRPRLNHNDLEAIRKVCVYYSRTTPDQYDGTIGELSRMMKSFFK